MVGGATSRDGSNLIGLTTAVLLYDPEHWRQPDYELFSWTRFPGILIMDTASYAVQSRFFKRLAFYVEKRGYRGRLIPEEEFAGLHGFNAHDYRAEDLARFDVDASIDLTVDVGPSGDLDMTSLGWAWSWNATDGNLQSDDCNLNQMSNRLGLLGITVTEDYGGAGMGYLAHVVATEEIARASASKRWRSRSRPIFASVKM